MSSSNLLRPRQGFTLIKVVVLMVLIAVGAYLVYVSLPFCEGRYQQAKYIEASDSTHITHK
jgi:type II secretory pathway component PulJ